MNRCWIYVLCLLPLPLLPAAPAAALPLPFEATLSLAPPLGTPFLLEVTATGGGTAAVSAAGNHLTGLAFGAGGIVGTFDFDPPGFATEQVTGMLSNGAASFAGSTGAGFGGVMPVQGAARVCLFGTCASPLASYMIPFSPIGVGGTATFMTPIGAESVLISVIGGAWTTGTITPTAFGFPLSTRQGFAHGPASATSSAAQPSGLIQLVAPAQLDANLGADYPVPIFATLTLHFVPEPGTALLLGAGVVGLAARARAVARSGARQLRSPHPQGAATDALLEPPWPRGYRGRLAKADIPTLKTPDTPPTDTAPFRRRPARTAPAAARSSCGTR
ncbi:MAG: PEP-CTERM sorting domain-containing protein [Myxococcota bacterium]|nr:PEP-CTERM sorting domain-containing protein [Myxococcota bacterium]